MRAEELAQFLVPLFGPRHGPQELRPEPSSPNSTTERYWLATPALATLVGMWITAAAPVAPVNRAALPLVLVGAFVTILDFFIVNVAIPSVQDDLGASAAEIQFVVAGYGLAYAVGLITGGRLGDIFGRRRMFIIGLAGFTAASVACGVAQTAVALVVSRVCQGIFAAVLFPQVLSILNVTYVGVARARAFTALAVTLGLAAASGQLIGGVLITTDTLGLSWRGCFLINLPIGVVALVLAARVLPESRSDTAGRLDLNGVALITAGLLLLVLPLVEGREAGWPAWSFGCLVAAPAVVGGFVLHQRHAAENGGTPLLDLGLFRQRSFVVGIGVILAFYAGLASLFLVLAVYLQDGQGYRALDAGLVFVPFAAGFFLTSLTADRIASRWGHQTLALGAVILAATYLILVPLVGAHPNAISGWILTPPLFGIGVGQGLVMGPVISLVLSGVRADDAGSASGVLATVQQVAGALGVALIGIVFYDTLGTHPRPGRPYAAALQHGLYYLATLSIIVAVLVQLLPARRAPTHNPAAK
jgi:EmrB/QacA subfamily drug resistance transporter